MKILGEELGTVGQLYVAVPPLVLIVFLVGLFVLAAAGQKRLDAADGRVHASEIREQALDEFLALITDAESEQRGYLLTGENSYFHNYAGDSARVSGALDRLHDVYGSNGAPRPPLKQLTELAHRKLDEMNETLTMFKQGGLNPATTAARADLDKRTTAHLLTGVSILRQMESSELSQATANWRSDIRLARWLTLGGLILNIALVILSAVLIVSDTRRRARQAADLGEQKRELARQVDERTRELTALSTHLQDVSEAEKAALSRELHDELGGLLVAARMDLSWLQKHLPTTDPAIEQRFKRIHDSLSAGVDLKRRVVEELRPTLLDNMGLFAALRWQFKESCRRAGLVCHERIPDTELGLSPDAAIGIFRVAQEALTNILKHSQASAAELSADIVGDLFVLEISDDGRGIATNRRRTATSHGLVSMRHRIAALEGTLEMRDRVPRGTVVTARVPLARMLASAEPDPQVEPVTMG